MRSFLPVAAGLLGLAVGVAVGVGDLFWLLVLPTAAAVATTLARALSRTTMVATVLLTAAAAAVAGGLSYPDPVPGATNAALIGAALAAALAGGVAWWDLGRRQEREANAARQLADALDSWRETHVRVGVLADRAGLAVSVHEQIGQRLDRAVLRTGLLLQEGDLPPAVRESLAALREELAGAVDALGDTVALLASGEGLGVPPGAAEAIERARAAGADISADLGPCPDASPLAIALADQVLAEALANAARMAPSAPVRVVQEQRAGHVVVEVSHPLPDGARVGGRNGLHVIAERLRARGGDLSLTDVDALRLSASVPLEPLARVERDVVNA